MHSLSSIARVSARSTLKTSTLPSRSYSGTYRWPAVHNEPLKHYAPGSPERAALKDALKRVRNEVVEVPCIINGKEVFTGNVVEQVIPSDHNHVIARVHRAGDKELQMAIDAALQARQSWDETPLHHRGQIFRKAADLISTTYRPYMNAVTMLGTGKTVWQGEIDSAAEQADFLRLNAKFAEEIFSQQPPLNAPGVWNRMTYRGLEGFVAAISPFNFAAIGTNLNSAPAIMGNTTVWKPSTAAALENYVSFKIMQEAGLPDGVMNFLPCGHSVFEKAFLDRNLAGLHFTGSTRVFSHLWNLIGQNITTYNSYPRIVGETGGKNFHVVHPSADVVNVVHQTIRAAFEYQGQKCSAASRAYIPKSLYPQIKQMLIEQMQGVKVGQPDDFSVFMSAVIDNNSFQKQKKYIDAAAASKDCEVIVGGTYDNSIGYFVDPTVIVTTDPYYETMKEELFGPVLTMYVYDDSKPGFWEDVLKLVDTTTRYSLTGAMFANDRSAIVTAERALRNSAGNLYINDKSTGAVVGEQPFGGARASGTNDKAGSHLNLLRWTSVQTVKETNTYLHDFTYPHMR